jgi:general secretion pathway protein A
MSLAKRNLRRWPAKPTSVQKKLVSGIWPIWSKLIVPALSGYLKSYVLETVGVSVVGLQDRRGSLQVSLEDFSQRWNGIYLYLWRAPDSYIAPLSAALKGIENISNPELVDWLQAQLAGLDNNSDIIISGGRYTAAIAQQVLSFQQQQGLVADGILGRETLMRLNQLSDGNIPLFREAD